MKNLLNKKIEELTTFKNLTKIYSKKLSKYNISSNDFFQYEKTDCISFDIGNVPYSFSNTNNLHCYNYNNVEKELDNRINHSINHFKLAYQRHHNIIKEVYELCSSLYNEDIWVMMGGGMQIQAFFGNSSGYIGILYLSMDDENFEPSDFKASFTVNGKDNDKFFINSFNVPNIDFSSHHSIYCKDEEESRKIKQINTSITNPIDYINNSLNLYSNLETINSNPLNILLHMFYAYGNGYSLVKNNDISFIYQERIETKPSIDLTAPMKIKLKELEDFYITFKKDLKNKKNIDRKKTSQLAESQLVELETLLKEKIENLQTNIKNNENSKIIKLKELKELELFEFDINNYYWQHFEKIVSNDSIATKIPTNLSKDWKYVFDILTKKMKEIDKNKVENTLNKLN